MTRPLTSNRLTTARVLMCPPDYYGIEYEINPWMDRRQPCDHAAAVRQWQDLRRLLEQAGAEVSCLPPVAGLPDLVFTANAAMIHGRQAILSRFRFPQRQGEEEHYASDGFPQHGFQVRRLRGTAFFEGAGDALFCGDTLFAGYRIRSDVGRAAGDRRVAGLPRDSAGAGRAPLLSPRHVFLPAGGRHGDLLSAGLRRLWPQGAGGIDSAADRRERRRGLALRLQRRGGGPDGDYQHRLPGVAAASCGRGFYSLGDAAWTSSSAPAAARSVSPCGWTAKTPPPGGKQVTCLRVPESPLRHH